MLRDFVLALAPVMSYLCDIGDGNKADRTGRGGPDIMTTFKVKIRTNDHPTAKHEVDFDAVENLMDPHLAQQIVDKLGLKIDTADEAQVLVDEYASAHERVFGKPFIVN